MNIFTLGENRVSASMLAFFTAVSLLLSAFPAPFLVAEAAHDSGAPYEGEVLGKTKDGGTIDKIRICHATASADNPYTNPEVNIASFFSSGHDQDLQDIIPPFHYTQGEGVKEFLGTNWTTDLGGYTGADLWKNGCAVTGSISGAKYNDVDNDGGIDGDTGIENWTIRLYEVDTPWVLIDTQTTDTDGKYWFTDVPAGEYKVCEVMQSDWTQTFVSNGTTNESPNSSEEGPLCRTVNIDKVGESNTVNFGNYYDAEVTGSITVKKVAGGDTTTEFDFSGGLGDFTLVGGGEHTVDDLKAGQYVITEEDTDGWDLLDITCNDVQMNGSIPSVTVDLAEGGDVTCVFTNRPDQEEPPICKIGDNLLANASFEDPIADANSAAGGFWELFDSVPNWVIEKVSDDTLFTLELWNGLFGGASDGDQNAELGGDGEATKVSQTVTTIPGATYELRFDFSPRPRTDLADNSVDALIDDVVLMNAQGDGSNNTATDWTTYSKEFVADDDTTKVTLKDVGTQNGTGSLVDNAVLCLIEEPQCEDENPGWADEAMSFDQGLLKNGNPVTANRSNADDATGPSNWVPGGSTGFVSLGFGGSIVVKFDKYVPDVDGDDLSIHEATNGTYPLEKVSVEVSQNGSDWEMLSEEARNDNNEGGTGVSLLDFSETGFAWIKYVRITDTSDAGLHTATADGFDLDAVDATKELCDEPEPRPKTGTIIVKKATSEAGENTGFVFMGDLGLFELLGNTEKSFEVEAGEYTITEKEKEGWVLASLSCDVDDEVVDDRSVTVDLEVGETITCEYGNREVPKLMCEPEVNLMENGGFEIPGVTHNAGWDIFPEGYTGLAWLIKWLSPDQNATDPASLELHAGVNGWLPSEGEQYAELDGDYEGPGGGNGEPASTEISQVIETIPGETYVLSWDFSPRPGTTQSENDLVVSVDGVEVANNSAVGGGANAWTSHSYSFEAAGDETEIAFADDGNPNSVGTFLDNVSLVCQPETPYGPYCGDGEVNQEWEQCDGGEECTEQCQWENQCVDLQLVKVNLTPTESVSFDGKLYLGSAANPIPAGVWFKWDENGDDQAQDIANAVDGLAIERDQSNGLQLAFRGDNKRRKLDIVKGSIELYNLNKGVITNYLVDALGFGGLENSGVGIDVITPVDSQHVNFHMRADTGNDSFTMPVEVDEEAIAECNPDDEEYRCSITASKNPVDENEEFTISWGTNADGLVEVSPLGSGLAMNDSTTTSITENTLFTLTVYGEEEEVMVSCDVEVTLDEDGGGGGGGGRKIELTGGGSGPNDDDEPVPQVLGEQVSVVPFGAPNAGAGGAAPVAPHTATFGFLSFIAILLGEKRYAKKA